MALHPGELSSYTDEALMTLVCAGHTPAFDELYQRYGRRLLGYFVRMLHFDRALAEDALQDLFLKIAEAPEKFDPQRSFKTWVFSVASNTCKNYYRHLEVSRHARHRILYEAAHFDDGAFVASATRIDAQVFRRLLEECLNALPREKKEAFLLKYQEDKTIAEIADIQGCPEGSVKSRLHYTVRLLEEKLKLFNPIYD